MLLQSLSCIRNELQRPHRKESGSRASDAEGIWRVSTTGGFDDSNFRGFSLIGCFEFSWALLPSQAFFLLGSILNLPGLKFYLLYCEQGKTRPHDRTASELGKK